MNLTSTPNPVGLHLRRSQKALRHQEGFDDEVLRNVLSDLTGMSTTASEVHRSSFLGSTVLSGSKIILRDFSGITRI